MNSLFRAAGLAALILAGSAAAASAQTSPATPVVADTMFRATTLNLAAHGEVKVAPDMATITLGVMTEGKTAAEATLEEMDELWEAAKGR